MNLDTARNEIRYPYKADLRGILAEAAIVVAIAAAMIQLIP
jgi:hypothetical protein